MQNILKEIDDLIEKLIENSASTKEVAQHMPAQKMLQILMTLKKPFRKQILDKFCSAKKDPISSGIRKLFSDENWLPYFRSMVPLTYFYWLWLQQFDLDLAAKQIDELVLSLIYGATGYKLLDTICDNAYENTAEKQKSKKGKNEVFSYIYLAKYLISHQQTVLAKNFNNHQLYSELLEKYDRLYCNSGLREQSCQFKQSPVSEAKVLELGHKSAPLLVYFALVLDQAKKGQRIPDYERMFYATTTAIQISDDLYDAPEDLLQGNITLASQPFVKGKNLQTLIRSPQKMKKEYKTFLKKSKHDLHLLTIARRELGEALKICHNYHDDVFELFILAKDIATLEKINAISCLEKS